MAGATKDHLIGLLLGAEEDWPQAFEQILRIPLILHPGAMGKSIAILQTEPFLAAQPVPFAHVPSPFNFARSLAARPDLSCFPFPAWRANVRR